MKKQDKPISEILLVIEVHAQGIYDKMIGPSTAPGVTVSGTEARVAIATLADSVMELAKTLSDINDKVETLRHGQSIQLDALMAVLKDRQTPYYRRAYYKLRSIFRYFIWRVPM